MGNLSDIKLSMDHPFFRAEKIRVYCHLSRERGATIDHLIFPFVSHKWMMSLRKPTYALHALCTLQAIIGSFNIGGLVVIELLDRHYELPEEIALPRHMLTGLQAPVSYPISLDTSASESRNFIRIYKIMVDKGVS